MDTTQAQDSQRQIERNIAIHNAVAQRYEARHGEIFNEVEQDRLRRTLMAACDAVRTTSEPLKALDFGCGSGNLTRHLLALGLSVTAADVSPSFLKLVNARFGCEHLAVFQMNGSNLNEIEDESYDLIATYSVLHHIPDYFSSIKEIARVCKYGGVIVLDHEQNEAFWRNDPVYLCFRREALRFDWRKYLTPSNYIHRVRRLFNPRHSNEGDIHVWPDDHIEWGKIKTLLDTLGFEIVVEEDYLLNRKLYRSEVYQRYLGRCTDTKVMMFRKGAA